MTVANRLDFLMKKEGINAYNLALTTGVNQPTISRILKGESKQPKIENIEPLAKYFNVTVDWLLFGGLVTAIDNATLEPMQPKIPLISHIAAGGWEGLVDEHQVGDAIEWVSTSKPPRRHTFALRVRGDSMMPRFEHGAIITVEPDEAVQHGRYVVAKRKQDTEATFKQYVVDAGRAYLKPLNPQYPTLEVDDDCRIVGVVVDVTMRLV